MWNHEGTIWYWGISFYYTFQEIQLHFSELKYRSTHCAQLNYKCIHAPTLDLKAYHLVHRLVFVHVNSDHVETLWIWSIRWEVPYYLLFNH